MITVKDFAAQYGCSETIVYRHIRNHKDALGDRVQKEHGKTWLTDEGADYIRGLMKQAPVVVSETSEEVASLRQQLDDANAAFQKYAAETAALLIKASEQIALAERSEANLQRAERLEAQNADLSAELGAEREKTAQAIETAQKATDELTEAKKQIHVAESALEKTNIALCDTIRERDELREWANLPAWKRLFVKPPVFEESKE